MLGSTVLPPREATPPLRSGSVKPVAGNDQVLLPRFLPVASYGDMSGNVEPVIHPSTTTEVVSGWKGDNENGRFNAHIHSLEVILDNPTSSLWLSAPMEDPRFFATDITNFSPPNHGVYVDCYASLLVAYRIDLYVIKNCVSKSAKLLAGAVKKSPITDITTCCSIISLNHQAYWPSLVWKFIALPDMVSTFTALTWIAIAAPPHHRS